MKTVAREVAAMTGACGNGEVVLVIGPTEIDLERESGTETRKKTSVIATEEKVATVTATATAKTKMGDAASVTKKWMTLSSPAIMMNARRKSVATTL